MLNAQHEPNLSLRHPWRRTSQSALPPTKPPQFSVCGPSSQYSVRQWPGFSQNALLQACSRCGQLYMPEFVLLGEMLPSGHTEKMLACSCSLRSLSNPGYANGVLFAGGPLNNGTRLWTCHTGPNVGVTPGMSLCYRPESGSAASCVWQFSCQQKQVAKRWIRSAGGI